MKQKPEIKLAVKYPDNVSHEHLFNLGVESCWQAVQEQEEVILKKIRRRMKKWYGYYCVVRNDEYKANKFAYRARYMDFYEIYKMIRTGKVRG